jgi:hypothetical protein
MSHVSQRGSPSKAGARPAVMTRARIVRNRPGRNPMKKKMTKA